MTTLRNPTPPTPCRYFRYVRHHDVPAYAALGWTVHDSLDGTHHGEYSTIMGWPFDVPASELPPEPDTEHESLVESVASLGGEE